MENNIKLINALCTSTFIVGLVTTLSWSYTSRWFGLSLLLASVFTIYYINRREKKSIYISNKINLKRSLLGFFLIIVDILYNFILKDNFMYFDYGMISAGLIIVLINVSGSKLLKLDEQKIAFSTYFIFLTVILYGFLFEGLNLFFRNIGGTSNLFWDWFSIKVVQMAVIILNLFNPTTANGATIDSNGFVVSVGYACSGVESISVFFSAVIAYFVSIKKFNFFKVMKYLLVGCFLLFFVNLLRIVTIILTGYYLGINKMMFVHAHLGWIFFVLSMTVFWYIVFNENRSCS